MLDESDSMPSRPWIPRYDPVGASCQVFPNIAPGGYDSCRSRMVMIDFRSDGSELTGAAIPPGRGAEMDEHDMRTELNERLEALDWSRGVTKTALIAQLADNETLTRIIGQYLSDGTYFSARDVLSIVPEQAWQDAQGGVWRGGDLPDAAAAQTTFTESPVAARERAASDAAGPEASPTGMVTGGPVANVRQVVSQAAQAVAQPAGQAVQTVTQTAAKVAERAGAAAHNAAGLTVVPDRVRQTATSARDQVLSVRTRSVEGATPDLSATTSAARPTGWSVLPVRVEGLGQAFDRRPFKVAIFAGLGLGLSVASGLDTWLARRVFRMEHATIGPGRVRPFLLGLWAATLIANVWDTWAGPRDGTPKTASIATDGRSASDPIGAKFGTAATDETDEFPTVGSS